MSSIVLCLLTLAVAFGAEQAAVRPLKDGLFLQGVDGRLVHDDVNDIWLFATTADFNQPPVRIAAETAFPLLPSSELESMVDDANDRVQPLYRLSALVTLYKGRNCVLPTYYLPLSQLKRSVEPSPAAGMAGPGVEPNTTLSIPGQILERVKNRGPLRAQKRSADLESQTSPARTLVDVIGFIEQRGGRLVFVPDGWGLGVSGSAYYLLPGAVLEQAQAMQAASPERVRFRVSGQVSDFKGRPYLLLRRALRAYSFGDFTG